MRTGWIIALIALIVQAAEPAQPCCGRTPLGQVSHPVVSVQLAQAPGNQDRTKRPCVTLAKSSPKAPTRFVAPTYPPLGIQGRVQGKVELQLTVAARTGEVQDAKIVSGHPILAASAIQAVKQWRFKPNGVVADTIRATLEFALECQ